MQTLLQRLFTAWFYLVFAFFLLLIYPYVLYGIKRPAHHARIHRWRSWGCRQVLRCCGWRVRCNRDIRHFDGPRILVSNHTSALDIVTGLALIRDEVHYVGKAELADIPLFGIFFRGMDIPIKREEYEGRKRMMEQAEADLKKGIHIFIFPEGTTSMKSPQLLNFKKGAFVLSKKCGVPVLPVTFVDHWHRFHYDFVKWRKPGPLRVEVGKEMQPGDYRDEMEMKEAAKREIEETLKKYFPDESGQSID